MSRSSRALLAFATVLGGAAEAHPSPHRSSPWDLSGSIALLTDYVDRGISQSDGHGAVQGDLTVRHSGGLYALLWASSVDFDDGDEAVAEVNYIAGFERAFDEMEAGLSVAYIHYPGAASAVHYDLVEFNVHMAAPAGPVDLRGDAIFSPEHAGDSGSALYLQIEVASELTRNLTLALNVGRQWIAREDLGGPDYNDWGVGLGWSRGRFNAGLEFTDTDGHAECGEVCDARVRASVGLSF